MNKSPQFLRPAVGPANVNQHAPRFEDRRTKRNRDRSAQQRKAIERSEREDT